MLPGHGGAEPRAPQRGGEGGGNGACAGRCVMAPQLDVHRSPGQSPPPPGASPPGHLRIRKERLIVFVGL